MSAKDDYPLRRHGAVPPSGHIIEKATYERMCAEIDAWREEVDGLRKQLTEATTQLAGVEILRSHFDPAIEYDETGRAKWNVINFRQRDGMEGMNHFGVAVTDGPMGYSQVHAQFPDEEMANVFAALMRWPEPFDG